MAEQPDRESQTEAPSQRKLDEARSKGDVAKSMDVPAFAALAAAMGCVLAMGGSVSRGMAESLMPFLQHPEAFDLSGNGGQAVLDLALKAALPGGVVMAAGFGAAVAGNLIQTGFLWVPSKLAPDPSKLSPAKGLNRLFGIDGLINFAKSLSKLAAVAAVAWVTLRPKADEIALLGRLDAAAILPLCMEWLKALGIGVLVVFGSIALVDWLIQRQRYMQKMRMSREELKQDTKNSEGDPHIKAKLRAKRMARSKQRTIQAVPKATMVVMNPTHYAVALRYVQGETPAPICVAKGLDALALKIREIAESHDISIIEDPPLARALYASIEVDETIPREHYEAVAKIVGVILGAARKRSETRARAPRPAGLGASLGLR